MSWGETLNRASLQIVDARPDRERGFVLKS
jgi:hypothetical protein